MCRYEFEIEFDREADGRVIAEVTNLPGVLVYGTDERDARNKARALAMRVIADRLENDEAHDAERGDLTFAFKEHVHV